MPDLKMARSQRLLDPFGGRLKKNFLLPDFATVMRGYVKPDDELPAIDDQVIGPLVGHKPLLYFTTYMYK